MRIVLMVSVLALLLLVGCDEGVESMPDGGVPDAPDASKPFDWLGEPCHAEPDPVVTVCHAGAGWCVADVCRPQCNGYGEPRCSAGRDHITVGGACYCAP